MTNNCSGSKLLLSAKPSHDHTRSSPSRESGIHLSVNDNEHVPIARCLPVEYRHENTAQPDKQAMTALYKNERYWFDEEEEAIMTESNQEFEQSPAIEQLFQVYYRAAADEEAGEW